MEGMDKIQDTLISIGCWIFGGFLLFLSLSIFLPHGFIAGLFFLLAAIVSIPLTAAKLENKLKVPLSGIVRFFAVFLLIAIAISALPPATPTTVNNTTAIAAPSSTVNGSDAIAVPSEPASTPTPTPTPAATPAPTPTPTPTPILTPAATPTSAPIPDKKGTLDIVTSPTGATVTIDGVSQGTTPVSGLSIDAGTHTVSLYLAGYDLHKETVNLANSETKSILWAFVPDTSQSSTPAATPEVTPTAEESTSQVVSETPMQLSESKKKELIGIAEQYYGAKDVFVSYGNGNMVVSYSIDSIPNPSDLYDDISGMLISGYYIAGECGITDIRVVNVAVYKGNGRGLGVGNYYVAGEKKVFDIDVSDCHP